MSASSNAAENSAEEEDDDEDIGGKFAKLDSRRNKDNDEYEDDSDEDTGNDEKDKEDLQGSRKAPVKSIIGKTTSVDEDISSILDHDAFIEVPADIKKSLFITEHKPGDARKGWTCDHCDYNGKTWNTTKIKAHLARKHGEDVKVCKLDKQPPNYADMYQRQWESVIKQRLDKEHKKQKFERDSDKQSREVAESMISAGSTRVAQSAAKERRASGQSSATKSLPISLKSPPSHHVAGQQFLPGTKECDVQMHHYIASFIHRGGYPFSLVEDPRFQKIIDHAHSVSRKYKVPNRKLIAGKLLDHEYNWQYQNNLKLLKNEADVYGLALYADGATIAKTPFINILASGIHKTNACLEIHDCSEQMAAGGKKGSEYIFTILKEHIDKIDPKKTIVDMVIFDGATNMQKAGSTIEISNPLVTCVHGAEHITNLFFSDVSKTLIGKKLIKLCRKIIKWFDGRHHNCHAIFLDHTYEECKRRIGLTRPADTRMGGYWIAWCRIYRLKVCFLRMIASKAFADMKKDQKPPMPLLHLLKSEEFWNHIYIFLRALYGPLMVLRYCDMKVPIMDKLYYLGMRAQNDLHQHLKQLNDWENLDAKNSFMALVNEVLDISDDSSTLQEREREEEAFTFGVEEVETGYADDDEVEVELQIPRGSFGSQIKFAWHARFNSLINPYVIAGWSLSPHPTIQAHVKEHFNADFKKTISALVIKLLVPRMDDPVKYKQLCSKVLNTYWNEWDGFNTRSGVFDEELPCWSSSDIDNNQTAKWHKCNSFYETEYLGKFACRVTSKIVGIGNAERCWGDVKTLKDGKRAHLSSEATSKQATVYGSACAERAEAERLRKSKDVEFRMWEDADMDCLGLDKFGMEYDEIVPSKEKREFKCWIEDWEKDLIHNKDHMSSVKLLTKYGGMSYLEDNKKFTIHKVKMNWISLKGKKKGAWHALGCDENYNPEVNEEGTFDNMEINEDLMGLIYTYYEEDADVSVDLVVRDELIDSEGKWIWGDDGPPQKKQKSQNKPKSNKRKNPN